MGYLSRNISRKNLATDHILKRLYKSSETKNLREELLCKFIEFISERNTNGFEDITYLCQKIKNGYALSKKNYEIRIFYK